MRKANQPEKTTGCACAGARLFNLLILRVHLVDRVKIGIQQLPQPGIRSGQNRHAMGEEDTLSIITKKFSQ